MKYKKIIFLSLLFIIISGKSQEKKSDPEELAHFDCGIVQTKQKLDKHFFASTPAIQLRVNNEEYTYTTLQFGKRKSKMYLYLRILKDNVCIKKDKNVDVHFKSGEIITLKNEYALNCDSFFAKELNKKELQKLRENEITLIKIYTYKKNYEMYVNEVQNQNIHHNIDCLSGYKIQKSNEVKIKQRKKTKEKDEPTSRT